jgi:hypothetical protein
MPVGSSIALQFEAALAAFHGDQAQQRCELLLVLRGNASHGQERAAVALRPRSIAVEPKRTLNGAQAGMNRSAFTIAVTHFRLHANFPRKSSVHS